MIQNLLITVTDFPPCKGGISTYSLELSCALSKICNVVVLAPGAPDAKRFDQRLPFDIIRTPPIPILRTVAFFLYIPWLLRQKKIEAVLHTVWPTALISHLFYCLMPVSYFISVYGSEILDDKRTWKRRFKGWLKWWRKATLKRAKMIFPVSSYSAKLIKNFGVDNSRVHVISCGVNSRRFRPIKKTDTVNEAKILLTVARLDLHKGHDRVLEALATLKDQGLTPTYIIAGTGDEEMRLREITQKFGLVNQVKFAGFVPDNQLPELYAKADIFIMASRQIPKRLDIVEGFGISFLEASASGIPVIAGNSGGVSDAVRNGRTGLLVDPNNADEIAHAIKLLLDDENLAKRLGDEGRRWAASEMNWDKIANRFHLSISHCN
jgi:phosphatidylinositol alpha-1,6-mannosyltransferase